MEDSDMMRQSLLMELIDNMHGRLADKMFPPNPDTASEPAATGIPDSEAANACPPEDVKDHGDVKGDKTGIPADEPDDDDLEDMLKSL